MSFLLVCSTGKHRGNKPLPLALIPAWIRLSQFLRMDGGHATTARDQSTKILRGYACQGD